MRSRGKLLAKALVCVGMLVLFLAPQLAFGDFGDIGGWSDGPHDPIVRVIDEDSTGEAKGYRDPTRFFLDNDVNDYLANLYAPLTLHPGQGGLLGKLVCAVVHDSDIGINYGPLNGSPTSPSSSLPELVVTVLDADTVCSGELKLLADAPIPVSSSDPFDGPMDP